MYKVYMVFLVLASILAVALVLLLFPVSSASTPLQVEHQQCSMEVIEGVIITAYTADPAETDDSPTITSIQELVYEGGAAASRDLLKNSTPYGARVCFSNHYPIQMDKQGEPVAYHSLNGECVTINDTTNKRKKRQIDVFSFSKARARNIGIGTADVTVVVCK